MDFLDSFYMQYSWFSDQVISHYDDPDFPYLHQFDCGSGCMYYQLEIQLRTVHEFYGRISDVDLVKYLKEYDEDNFVKIAELIHKCKQKYQCNVSFRPSSWYQEESIKIFAPLIYFIEDKIVTADEIPDVLCWNTYEQYYLTQKQQQMSRCQDFMTKVQHLSCFNREFSSSQCSVDLYDIQQQINYAPNLPPILKKLNSI